MAQRQNLLNRSVSVASKVSAKVKRRLSQPSGLIPINLALDGGAHRARSMDCPRIPPLSTCPPAAPFLRSFIGSQDIDLTAGPSSPKLDEHNTPSTSTASDHTYRAPQTAEMSDDEDMVILPSRPRELPSYYGPPTGDSRFPMPLPGKSMKSRRSRTHRVRRSIERVSDMLLGPWLLKKRAGEHNRDTIEDPTHLPHPPQLERLSFASEVSTGTLERYLAYRHVEELFEQDVAIGMSLYAYECNGSWVRELERRDQATYICPHPSCEAHHRTTALQLRQRRKSEEKVWFKN